MLTAVHSTVRQRLSDRAHAAVAHAVAFTTPCVLAGKVTVLLRVSLEFMQCTDSSTTRAQSSASLLVSKL
jgi:hypothetical protein